MKALKFYVDAKFADHVFISCIQFSVESVKFLNSFDNSSIKLVFHSIIHKSAKSYLWQCRKCVCVCASWIRKVLIV